jgi:putative tricarboxylic transport membrane protein
MFFANVAIFGLGWFESKTIVHLLRVPFSILGPTILLISTIGAFAARNLVVDVWVMYAAGIVGYLMRRSGYSMPGIVLGLILGRIGESAFVKTMQMLDYSFLGLFTRPISAILLVLTILSLGYNLYEALKKRR